MLITRSPCQTRAGEAVGAVGDEGDVRTVGGVAEGVCPVWELGQPVERSAVAVDCSPDNIQLELVTMMASTGHVVRIQMIFMKKPALIISEVFRLLALYMMALGAVATGSMKA